MLCVNFKNFRELVFLLFVHKFFVLVLEIMTIVFNARPLFQFAQNEVNFFELLANTSLGVLCLPMNCRLFVVLGLL